MNSEPLPRVGFFSFTSCEGCQLAVLECEDQLVDLLQAVEIVRFREAASFEGPEIDGEFDVAFIEGSVSTEHDFNAVKDIRRRSKAVISLGACAATAGLNALKNLHELDEIRNYVYGERADWYDTIPTRPVHTVIKVEGRLRGCPIDRAEFVDAVTRLIRGLPLAKANIPLCAECKRTETVCHLLRGNACLGPVTVCGCGAICTRYGHGCEGCRGLLPNANISSMIDTLTDLGMQREDAIRKIRLFNAYDAEKIL